MNEYKYNIESATHYFNLWRKEVLTNPLSDSTVFVRIQFLDKLNNLIELKVKPDAPEV